MTIIDLLIQRGWNLSIQTTKRNGVFRLAFAIQTSHNSWNYYETDTLHELQQYSIQFLDKPVNAVRYTEDLEKQRPPLKPINLESLL